MTETSQAKISVVSSDQISHNLTSNFHLRTYLFFFASFEVFIAGKISKCPFAVIQHHRIFYNLRCLAYPANMFNTIK